MVQSARFVLFMKTVAFSRRSRDENILLLTHHQSFAILEFMHVFPQKLEINESSGKKLNQNGLSEYHWKK